MPKTNHQRNFRDKKQLGLLAQLIRANKIGMYGNDFTDGKHGLAKSKRGLKKFRNSRKRFHQNSELKKVLHYGEELSFKLDLDGFKTVKNQRVKFFEQEQEKS